MKPHHSCTSQVKPMRSILSACATQLHCSPHTKQKTRQGRADLAPFTLHQLTEQGWVPEQLQRC
jgi:hypothetical protein